MTEWRRNFGTTESIRSDIGKSARDIREAIDSLMPSVRNLANGSAKLEQKELAAQFNAWLERLEWLGGILKNPVEEFIPNNLSTKQIATLLSDETVLQASQSLASIINERFPSLTEEQRAWELLIRLEENLKALENENEVFNAATVAQQRAQVLLNSFQSARDKVLGTLFENVKARFEQMYRQIHGTDEDSFTAKLEHVNAGLSLEVDFHGLGTHPPQALHSEGHQDTMGICLYLALAEMLTKGVIDIVILDDVVMSVDSEHRRELCKLFRTAFPHKQFIITTHDKTWASQLRYQGVVQSKESKEFYGWQLDTGPRVNQETDIWLKIGEDLAKGDVSGAAARLRRGSEDFYSQVCHSLKGLVPYNASGNYDLGVYLSAARGKLTSLLKKANEAANSWNDRDTLKRLAEVDKNRELIFKRVDMEQWAINPNVHYNNWANFTAADFRPVVDAFHDMSLLFTCSSCGGVIELIQLGLNEDSLRCGCRKINWNLRKK